MATLLDPTATGVWNLGNPSPLYVEDGITPIPQGATTVNVVFTTEKSSELYAVLELQVENIIDAFPFQFLATVRTRRTAGFTVLLDGIPDTGNYQLRWRAAVTQI